MTDYRKIMTCKCSCGFDTMDHELKKVYLDLEERFTPMLDVISGCRCIEHNELVGGSPKSKHLWGQAMDLGTTTAAQNEQLWHYLCWKHSGTYGIGIYNGSVHIDVRKQQARWDKRRA